MNKTLYKVIFNQKRGIMVAVAENAARAGKSAQDGGGAVPQPAAASFRLPLWRFSLMMALGLALVLPARAAGIGADKSAPQNQQPTVLQTANGLPQVNIQTPSAGGVSVNQYRQFDVDGKGAVLNNSRRNVQTQLGGWVQGNPWLAGGEARVIVNQVNSANPSLLNGYIEVAGRRAEVVMANPAGIRVNGGGFINAAGVTLTTGKPLLNNGHLEGFRVRGGRVAVEGRGLDTAGADYTRILAQAAAVNAGIWANDLQVAAGNHDMGADGVPGAVADGLPPAADTAKVAIDTGALGGMYAGKITLISTDKGVGIHNAGQIFAAAGGVTLSADGNIGNSGSMVASNNTQGAADSAAVTVKATALDNSGSISAQGRTNIQTASFNNSGLLAAAGGLDIRNSGHLNNSGRINAARFDIETGRLNNSGTITQTGLQALAVSAGSIRNHSSGLIGATPADSGNNDNDNDNSSGNNNHSSNTPAPTTAAGNGSTQTAPAAAPLTLAAGRIAVSDGLDNRGRITANGDVALSSRRSLHNQGVLNLHRLSAQGSLLNNQNGSIRSGSADIAVDTLNNRSGSLLSSDGLILRAQTLSNQNGTLQSAGSLRINSQNFNNRSGQTAAPDALIRAVQTLDNQNGQIDTGRLKVEATELNNHQGKIRSDEATELKVSDGLNNQSGLISSAKDVKIHDGNQQTLALNNASGEILAGQNLDLQAKTLAKQGALAANQNLSLNLKDSFSAEQDIRAGQGLRLSSEGDINNSHTLAGGRFVRLEARRINNTDTGQIQSGSDTHLQANNITNRGLINSNGLTLLEAGGTVSNIGTGRVYGDWVGIEAAKLVNREETVNGETKAATVAAREHLAIGAKDITNQEGAKLSSEGSLNIGLELNESHQAQGLADRLVNAGATIEAGADARIGVKSLQNLNNHFRTREYLDSSKHIVSYTKAGEAEPFFTVGEDGVTRKEKHDFGFIYHDGRPEQWLHKYAVEQYYQADYVQNVYKQQIIDNRPAHILVGGNLQAEGNWLNHNSMILSGGAILGKGNIRNEADKDTVRTVNTGMLRRGSYDKHGFRGDRHIEFDKESGHIPSPPDSHPDFELKTAEVKEYGNALPPPEKTAAQAITRPSTVTGGGSSTAPINTLNTDTKLPASGLYTVNPANPAYWVETDPAFTNNKQWLGSDYMLNALNIDPNNIHKRLGDGYYEQKLINEQIARLTGYRRLDGYQSDEAQYQALMSAGITFAREQQLSPGIKLSAEQIARLTSDIVWLETQTLTLIDGSTVEVLAPKVYLTVKPDDLTAHGGLISADKLAMDSAGSIINSGTLAGRKVVDLSATDIKNSGLIQGGKVGLRADDVHIEGGTVSADTLLAVEADRLRIASTTATGGDERNGQTQIDRVAALYVNNASDGRLSLKANENIDFVAANLRNEAANGQTQIVSDGHIDLGTAKLSSHSKQGELSDRNHRHVAQTSEAGTVIGAAGDILISAKDDLTIRQGSIAGDGGRTTLSGRNVDISEGRQTLDLDDSLYNESRSMVSKTTSLDQYRRQHDEAVGSSIEGKEVVVRAGQDVNVRGSRVVSDGLTVLTAGNDVNITAAENAYSDHEFHERKRSGFTASLANGVAAVGYSKSRHSLQQDGTSQSLTLSRIGSSTGNTALLAGDALNISAGRLNTGGDLNLQGRAVNLDAAYITDSSRSEQQSKQSGLSIGVTYNPIAAAKTAYDQSMAGSQNSGSAVGTWFARDLAALKAAQAAMTPLVVSGGRSKSSAEQNNSRTQAVVSELAAGQHLNIIATEGGIRSEGAQISAEGDALLSARDSIRLGFAADGQNQSAQSRRSGLSIDNRDHLMPLGSFNERGQGEGALNHLTGSSLSVGGAAALQSGRDIDVIGSTIVAQNTLSLNAADNITILSGQNRQSLSETQVGSGIGSAQISDTEYFSGWMKNRQDSHSSQVEQVKSQVGSLGGNVNMQAGAGYTQQVADVAAAKDINITANNIDILDDYNRGSSHQSERDVKIGTFAKVSSPLIELAYAVEDAVDSNAGDRTRALQGMAAAAQGYQLYDAVGKVTDAAARNTKVAADALKNGVAVNPDDLQQGAVLAKAEAGVGFKTANASQNQSYADSRRNTLSAGGNLTLQSTAGDIRLQHTAASAGGTLSLDSAKDISLESGRSSQHSDGKNSSFGASVGVGASVGAQTGIYVYAEAGATKGRHRLDAGSYNPTELNAGHIRLNSRGDTTLRGATATANRIDADVKGRLNIESVQDTLSQESKQSGAGARIQIALGSAWEASGNFNQSKASGSSNTVHTQSGLFAGDGGYHINAGSVQLKGGAIASTAAKENNGLTTGALTFEDIQNHSSYNAFSVSLSGSYGGSLSSGETFQQSSLGQASATAGQGMSQGPSYSPTLPQYESGGDSSTTRATLSAGRLNIGGEQTTVEALGIHSNTETAHQKLAELPDIQQILRNQQAAASATADITSAVRTFSGNMAAEAQKTQQQAYEQLQTAIKNNDAAQIEAAVQQYNQAQQSAKDWGIGGSKARALNAVSTVVTGALGGQNGLQTATNALAPYAAETIGQTFGQNGSNPNETAQLLSHALLAGILAAGNGGDFGAGAAAGAGAEVTAKVITEVLAGKEAANHPNLLSEEQKTTIRDLSAAVGALASGLSGGSAADIQRGGVVGQNAVENNWLSSPEVERLIQLGKACNGGAGLTQACAERDKLKALDVARDLRLLTACQNAQSTQCLNLKREATIAMGGLSVGYLQQYGMSQEAKNAHNQEYSSTDAAVLMASGYTPEQIAANTKLTHAVAQFLGDLSVVGTIRDFKEADTVSEYAIATIFAMPGLKQAEKVRYIGDFRKAYQAAKETGDLKAAKELLELARNAEKLPNNFRQLAQKEKELQLHGQNFGKLGVVIKNPNIQISGLRKHYIDRKIERGVTSSQVIDTVQNPSLILKQSNGGFLFLSQDAAVVINKNGQLVTTYGKSYFDKNIHNILDRVK